MKGRVSIVTGCNTGIGYETAQALAEADGTVIFACRSEDKARAAIARMMEDSRAAGKELSEDQLLFLPLDLASLESVRGFVDAVHRSKLEVHLLILNAGVMLGSRSVTKDGLEGTLAANHFGHFLLALLLLPTLQEAEARGQQPRIVMLGSTTCLLHGKFDFSEAVIVNGEAERKVALDKPYSLMEAYGQSKLANLLFVRELSRRMKELGSQIPVNCAHPGQVLTEVMRDMHPALVLLTKVFQIPGQALIKTPRQGSFCTLHVATAPELATAAAASGEFFVRLQPIQLPEAPFGVEAPSSVIARHIAVLVLSLLMSLALALAQMKTEKLSKEVKATLAPRTPAQRSSEAVGDAEEPQRRRRPKRVRRSPLQRMVLQFFIADEGSEDESSQGDEGPYQLDDGCWISLPEDACARTRPAEHFIGDKNISQAESNRGIPAPPEDNEDDEPVG
ncbi:unnamed protein product [Polarella glacialis]|uniref:Protochlorophyllide reductase n=1 Tax=Polarella glacialis TaxID=89957 RepID=A0A813H3Z6_POLGL|nr:unnamed protein product [Polarella glacialis]